METAERINIRGSINCLEIAETVSLPRALCLVSSVRNIAGQITTDTKKKFTVSVKDDDNIVVTRIS